MTEPVLPRYRDTPTRAPVVGGTHSTLADAALRNQRQIAVVLIGLAVLFVGGWLGLLAAGAKPVAWGQLMMVLTFTIAALMLVDAIRRLHVVRAVRALRGVDDRWQPADAHWIGRRGLRGRRLMVLSADGAACLWVRAPSPATERAVDDRGRVLMLRPNESGHSAVLVDQRGEVLLARVTSAS